MEIKCKTQPMGFPTLRLLTLAHLNPHKDLPFRPTRTISCKYNFKKIRVFQQRFVYEYVRIRLHYTVFLSKNAFAECFRSIAVWIGICPFLYHLCMLSWPEIEDMQLIKSWFVSMEFVFVRNCLYADVMVLRSNVIAWRQLGLLYCN